MSTASDWFRSAEMEYISIVMQEHCAHRCLARLGRLGSVQFADLNPGQTAVQRRFIHEVKRCDALERKLAFFDQLMIKYDVKNDFKYDVNTFLDKIEHKQGESKSTQSSLLQELEGIIEAKEKELQELNGFRINLSEEYLYQVELKQVLQKSRQFLEGDEPEAQGASGASLQPNDAEAGGMSAAESKSLRFKFLTGTLLLEDKQRFERMIFRATRGNCLIKFSPLEFDKSQSKLDESQPEKNVFIIFYQAESVEKKIKRLCEAFSATLYQIPELEDTTAFLNASSKVKEEISDRWSVLERNRTDMEANLMELCRWLEIWKWSVGREKSIFHTLNHFSADVKGVLRAEAWVIKSEKQNVQQIVYDSHESNSQAAVTVIQENQRPKMPPTYFKTNKFTTMFQLFVDTYGVPKYREANPALFTVVTFPFLFGIMFGDIGHGILLFLFAAFVIYNEEKFGKYELNEMTSVLYNGRYFLILMGWFSFYAGLLYNDYFAMGLHIFEVGFIENSTNFSAGDRLVYVPINGSNIYPVGVDPTWHHAENGLLFFNSMKMKMAVIFGVTHMTVGLFLKLANAISERNWLDVFFEVIPQMVFLLGLFGYMCFLIILKWFLPWRPFCNRELNCEPPSIITTMIDMFLDLGNVQPQNQFFESQANVQLGLILLVVLSIPLMLFPKPIILIRRMNAQHKLDEEKKHKDKIGDVNGDPDQKDRLIQREKSMDDLVEEEEEHSASDIWIHQGIETIEFCLGGISNTASYLRLWALSLAHSQLGIVFLTNTLLNYITLEGPLGVIITFFGYGGFAGITFAVLLVMDNLECFLHALRLHWVEFQSKFYSADGVSFTPLHFQKVLTQQPAAM